MKSGEVRKARAKSLVAWVELGGAGGEREQRACTLAMSDGPCSPFQSKLTLYDIRNPQLGYEQRKVDPPLSPQVTALLPLAVASPLRPSLHAALLPHLAPVLSSLGGVDWVRRTARGGRGGGTAAIGWRGSALYRR